MVEEIGGMYLFNEAKEHIQEIQKKKVDEEAVRLSRRVSMCRGALDHD